jgi:hypothetical protein
MNAPLRTIVRGVQQDELEAIWPQAAPLIERALAHAHGDYDLASVRASLEDGAQPRRQLFVTWPYVEAAGITAIELRPCVKVLVIFAYSGRLVSDWQDILAAVEGWAKAEGCSAVEIQGRRGWERMLPGYRRLTLLRKELSP